MPGERPPMINNKAEKSSSFKEKTLIQWRAGSVEKCTLCLRRSFVRLWERRSGIIGRHTLCDSITLNCRTPLLRL